MKVTSEQSIAEIATANPAAARVFERLGIDYCCRGKLSLRAACECANVALAAALEALEACETTQERPAPLDAPLGDLTRPIVERHHGFVRRESPRIQALLAKVAEKHGRSHEELFAVQRLFAALDGELAQHMMKEERILFPYLEALAGGITAPAFFGSVEDPIAQMIADHEDAGAILSEIRALTKGYTPPGDACLTFRALYAALEEFERDLHWHVHLENNIVFPRAIPDAAPALSGD
ncbi:MAG TPA: iron-sulfur cluster repair di-iron protein [Bryobacteraceae bacterium]|nr:iron-sulfur cluster repair di-iron protein [Bryobacteraceae bacterium]